MAVAVGGQLGAYTVRELIGAGGMGEVYLGHDARLNRSVALKILPPTFAHDADRLARFKREAQLLASLNHPNIASIFGLEEADGVQALVLEFVEGPTLADRVSQGPLPLDEAMAIARQVADALDAAHAQGIVHRDLKPANIKVRTDGTVKVLDFGLAKALVSEASTASVAQSPTITSPALTQRGVILGTAAYMSPEQARGRSADKRSDIWAFGAVFFEMLTGTRAFVGDDMSDTLANILKSDPDWSALPADTPANVRRVIRRCLEKDPKRRVHDINDARLELEEFDASPPAPGSPARRLLTVERAAWALMVAVLAGLVAYIQFRPSPPSPVVRFQLHAPDGGFFGSNTGVGRADGTSGGALAPDGTQLAFIGTDKARRTQLWVRRFDSFVSRPLPGTDDALLPFWSPDSRSIGFFANGKVHRVDVADGSIQAIGNAAGVPRGATWGSRDVIVFAVGTPPQLARVSARGGTVTAIATPGITFPRWPSFLPDGIHFVFTGRLDTAMAVGLLVASTEPGFTPRFVAPSNSNGAFAPPGGLLFVRDERLMHQPFDLDRLEITGEATAILDQVIFNPGLNRGDFSVSNTGTLAYRSVSFRNNQFAWFDRAGKLLETVGAPGSYRTPDLSPDGQRLVYGDSSQRDLWILDLVRGTTSRFTTGSGSETSPAWFPDGSKIAYRDDQGGMFEKPAATVGPERTLLKSNVNGPSQVSSDGKWILYFAVTPGGDQDIYVLPTTADAKPQIVVQTGFPEVEPQFSPDVRWLAYASNENGRNEIYVQPFPPDGRRWQVSSNGGRQPLWRVDGKELFFVSDDRRFYAVDVSQKAGEFAFGTPQFLFDMPANVFNSRNSYVPSRDGKRFLINTLLDVDDAPINVVQNWRTALH